MAASQPFHYYHYDPSLPAAVIFIVFFVCTTMLHTYQLVTTRTWIAIPLVVGGFCTCSDSTCESRANVTIASRVDWVYLPGNLQQANSGLDSDSVRYAECPHLGGTCPVRRHCIHGAGSYHPARRRGASRHHHKAVAYEGVRHWRCMGPVHPCRNY